MTYVLGDGKDEKILNKFLDFATHVRGLPSFGDPLLIAKAAIKATRNFRDQLGAPAKLSDLAIHDPDVELLTKKVMWRGDIGFFRRLNKEDVTNILRMCE